jgi:outer membrane protein
MMPLRWTSVALLVAALAALPTSRAAGQTLTLRHAAEQALARYPEVRAAAASREAAMASRGNAQAARRPSLQLSSSVTSYQEPMLVTPLHGFDPQAAPSFDRTLVHGAVTAAYTLFDGGEGGARVRMARAQEEVATASWEAITRGVLQSVVVEYVSVLAMAEVVAAHDSRVQALRAELEAARARVEAGRAPRVEVLRAQAELDRAEAERTRAATELEVAQGNLARLIGAREDAVSATGVRPVRLVDEALPPREELLQRALVANPDLQRARQEAEIAAAGVRVARSSLWPRLELVGRFDNRGAPGQEFQGEWSVGGRLSLPLFDGGARGSEVSRARAEGEAADERVRLAELRLRERLDRTLASVRDAEARIGSLNGAVRQWEEVARAERVARDAGAGLQTDYLEAQASLVSTRASLAEVRMRAIVARAELARLTGTLSLEWLDANLEDGA